MTKNILDEDHPAYPAVLVAFAVMLLIVIAGAVLADLQEEQQIRDEIAIEGELLS